ncbi:hypothetical protein Ciccas_008328 [Cichlidogyrus casuarinus]|uniref:E3 ubiquitin-protein ligase n=1 Tax=Cichlidogyrus casuarinus TaxID=1844966 RepID=A0ABD2Q099_9PLAT
MEIEKETQQEDNECSICLQSCLHPVELPCNHHFCFLCIKGFALRSKTCPLCRANIPSRFFEQPKIIKNDIAKSRDANQYSWFYEGGSGWWEYEERTAQEIEARHASNIDRCELVIAGYPYIIDFIDMNQSRRDGSGRVRRIKRDLANSPKLGIAGIRIPSEGTESLNQSCSRCRSSSRRRSTNTRSRSRSNQPSVILSDSNPVVHLVINSPEVILDPSIAVMQMDPINPTLNINCIFDSTAFSRSMEPLNLDSFIIPTQVPQRRRGRSRVTRTQSMHDLP